MAWEPFSSVELLPVHMPEAHAMRPLVADPFASSLLAQLRHGSTILLEDCVDSVVWQIQSISMLQYVFEG